MKDFSDSLVKISTALAAASKDIGGAVKGSANPYFKSKFADLPSVIQAIKEPLENQGIVILQPIITEDNKTYLQTVLLHSSGEYISSKIPLDLTGKEQVLGSRISYLRRYQLQAMLSIPAIDDDGEAAMQRKPATQENKTIIKSKSEPRLITEGQIHSLYEKIQSIPNLDKSAFEQLLFEKYEIPYIGELRLLNETQYLEINKLLDRKKERENGRK